MFTIEEIDALYAPFPLNAHSIREGNKTAGGKIQWFVYLSRGAVQIRLDQLFPGEWEFIYRDSNVTGDIVTVYTSIRIRGIERSYNGTEQPPPKRKKKNDDGTTDDDDTEVTVDENTSLGAMTGAFRRTASMWGCGLYLYEEAPKIYTAGYKYGDWNAQKAVQTEAWNLFTNWYNREFNVKTAPPVQSTPPKQQNAPAAIVEPKQATPAKPQGNNVWTIETFDFTNYMARTKHLLDNNQHRANAIWQLHNAGALANVGIDEAITIFGNRKEILEGEQS